MGKDVFRRNKMLHYLFWLISSMNSPWWYSHSCKVDGKLLCILFKQWLQNRFHCTSKVIRKSWLLIWFMIKQGFKRVGKPGMTDCLGGKSICVFSYFKKASPIIPANRCIYYSFPPYFFGCHVHIFPPSRMPDLFLLAKQLSVLQDKLCF